MQTLTIDGNIFEQMIRCSLQNLSYFEEEINIINVFPVSDGDTGSNMKWTLANGINAAPSSVNLGEYLKDLSKGILFGARGNSGVILSQIFKGIYSALKDKEQITVKEFGDALVTGAEFAQKAVIKPVEGTILTVTREGIARVINKISNDMDFLSFFKLYLASLQSVLEQTPEYLPVLKANGVLDSGGTGYFKIMEGMKKFLSNEIITPPKKAAQTPVQPAQVSQASAVFTKDSAFNLGYCMEFILQILESKKKVSEVNLHEIIETLKAMGESLVAIQEDSVIKIHIHVMNPVPVLNYILQFGEFVSFKLENMQLQNNEHFTKVKKDLCLIAVANCPEIKNLFLDLGCDYVIEDSNMQQSTTSDFINAINIFEAQHYRLLPNSKELVPPALQAKEILNNQNITVIPTTDVVKGYYSLAMDESDSTNIDFRIKQITEGAEYITTLLVTTAVKSCVLNNLDIKNGDKIFINEGTIIHNSDELCTGLIDALGKMDLSEKSLFFVFTNDNVSDKVSSKIQELLGEKFPDIQLSFLKNPNSIYELILGVV